MSDEPNTEDASRQALVDRLRQGRERAAQARASAAAVAEPPKREVRNLNEVDIFRANRQNRGGQARDVRSTARLTTTEEDLEIPEGAPADVKSGRGSYTAPPLVRMYKPNRFGYYDPVDIADGAVETCYLAGYLAACPDCNSSTCGLGVVCPNQPPRLYRVCPVIACSKEFRDEPQMTEEDLEGKGDPLLIKDDAFANSTPETRTKAMLNNHMMFYHPQESLSLAPHLVPLIMARMAESRT